MRYQRELTAAVLIPAVLAVLIAGPLWAWALLVAAATAAALVEFQGMLGTMGWGISRGAGLVLLLALEAAAYAGSAGALTGVAAVALFALPTLALFSAPPGGTWLQASATNVLATLYVGAGGAAVIALRARSWRAVLLLLAIVWAGDSAAYYAGRRWGRRRLAPVVSPKKSWEGFWAQLLAGALLAAVAAPLLAPNAAAKPVLVLAGAFLGLLLSAAAVVGDLVESTFKRSCAVKDSGGLLPGHGGLLDRLDSLLYASPLLVLVLAALPAGSVP